MIETNRAELWAVSVAIDGFATFGVLACPVRDFLDVRFDRGFDGASGKPACEHVAM